MDTSEFFCVWAHRLVCHRFNSRKLIQVFSSLIRPMYFPSNCFFCRPSRICSNSWQYFDAITRKLSHNSGYLVWMSSVHMNVCYLLFGVLTNDRRFLCVGNGRFLSLFCLNLTPTFQIFHRIWTLVACVRFFHLFISPRGIRKHWSRPLASFNDYEPSLDFVESYRCNFSFGGRFLFCVAGHKVPVLSFYFGPPPSPRVHAFLEGVRFQPSLLEGPVFLRRSSFMLNWSSPSPVLQFFHELSFPFLSKRS